MPVDRTTDPVLSVSDLEVRYHRSWRRHPHDLPAVHDITFSIGPAETVALVGESGSGKSTIARAILGLAPVSRGTIEFQGRDLAGVGKRERRQLSKSLQSVFQDPYSSLNPNRTIGATLQEPLLVAERLTKAERARRIAEILAKVGLPADTIRRYPGQFSGGQRQRIAIARTLGVNPRLIICDEPVSALDLSIQGQVLNLLMDVQHDLGVSYLFISHNFSVVRRMAHRTLVMYQGTIVEEGPTSDVIAHPKQAYTQRLLNAVLLSDPAAQRRRHAADAPAASAAS